MVRGQNFTMPASVYMGLMTTQPTMAGTASEVSYIGYIRAIIPLDLNNMYSTQLTFGAGTLSTGSSGLVQNVPATFFPSVAYNTIFSAPYWAVFDLDVGGNMLMFGDLSPAMTGGSGFIANGGNAPTIQPGAFQFRLDN